MQGIGKTATQVKVGQATGEISVTYHYTEVVNVTDESITLQTGGWFTSTTKRRMNEVAHAFNLGFQVFQKEFSWFVSYRGETVPFNGDVVVLAR